MTFTVDDVRSKLYDETSSNILLDDEEYTDATITSAMNQILSYWNSLSPLVSTLEYSTPGIVPDKYSEMFLKGTIGVLLTDRSLLYSRNRPSGEMDPASTQRVQEYKQIGDQYIKLFYEWAANTKRALASKLLRTGL